MNLKEIFHYNELKKTTDFLKKRFSFIVYPTVIDVLFLFIFGFVLSSILFKFRQYLEHTLTLIIQEAGGASQKLFGNVDLFTIITGDIVLPPLLKLIILFILIMISTYLLYSIFLGFSFWLCNNFDKISLPMKIYVKRFFLVNLLWVPLFFLYTILSFFYFFFSTTVTKMPSTASQIYNVSILAFIMIITYFALISYTLINQFSASESIKRSFSIGIKKAKMFIPMYAIICLALFILNAILNLGFLIHPSVRISLGIILVIPSFAIIRIFISLVIKKIPLHKLK